MVTTILGGLAIFGVSEIAGEVYHTYHNDSEKNIAIKAGKKLADCEESISDELAKAKEKLAARKEIKKGQNPKLIVKENSSVEDIMSTLDKQLENINKEKSAEVSRAIDNVVKSIYKVADILIKSGNLSEEDIAALEESKTKAIEISEKIAAGVNSTPLQHANIKKSIKTLAERVQPYVEKNHEIEVAKKSNSEDKVIETEEENKGTFIKDEKTVKPDFTKPLKNLTTVADVKNAAKENKNTNK